MEELRDELSRLPDHTVVLYLTMFQDAAGTPSPRGRRWTSSRTASRAPIYGFYDTFLGHGIVGGSMVTFEEIGRKAAQFGIRMLAGEDRASCRTVPSRTEATFRCLIGTNSGDGTSAKNSCRPPASSGSKRPRIGSNITDLSLGRVLCAPWRHS